MDIRSFEDGWQDHKDPLHRYALSLKQQNVADAEILCERTYNRAEPKWLNFKDKGKVPNERAWLKMIMLNLHLSDVREGEKLAISVDEPKNNRSVSGWDRIPDSGVYHSSDAWLKNHVLRATIADVTALITGLPDEYGLTQQDVDLFLEYRGHNFSLETIAAQRSMHLIAVEEAIARVDSVFRDLFAQILNYDPDQSDEIRRVLFDNCFDSVTNSIETDIQMGVLPAVTLTQLTHFRYYYAHHEPTQTQCAMHFTCAVGRINGSLQNIRPEFCTRWQNACPKVRKALNTHWKSQSEWKARFLNRWSTLQLVTEASICAELEKSGLPHDHAIARAKQEYEAVKHEKEQLRLRRMAYEKDHGPRSLTHREPTELFTRRERFALQCDGVALPLGQGHPGQN